jgi:FtsP/CotA-like multicopper oxidase with cupredoxin domain
MRVLPQLKRELCQSDQRGSKVVRVSVAAFIILTLPAAALALNHPPCSFSGPGSAIVNPKDLRSRNGVLKVTLTLRNSLDSFGRTQYCYLDEAGDRSPTLRLQPGDLLILKLRNNLSGLSTKQHVHPRSSGCTSGSMSSNATNLHFHGLSIPPSCHADDSLKTFVGPSQSFTYRFQIPENQPPGLYWYHPHSHGHSEEQVLGGASGALIVEGIAQANPLLAGLPERVLIIRDQNLEHLPTVASPQDPTLPAKDLSMNFVSIPYPEYPVGTVEGRPLTRELWRVLNASADTYVNLGVLFNGGWSQSGLTARNGSWQSLGLVAVDGVPLEPSASSANVIWRNEIAIPPGGRAEFIFQMPPEGTTAELITAGAQLTPPDNDDILPRGSSAIPFPDRDDNTPPRPLAKIISSRIAAEPRVVPNSPPVQNSERLASLIAAQPVRQRKLYFSEKVMDPKNPGNSTAFYITEEGEIPKAFDPSTLASNIVVHQGEVEDWTIENRSRESHAFHIHQLHFLLLERDGSAVSDPYLADTVDVPYWDGISQSFPSVKLRMDFRDPNVVGLFPYHCHILQHADNGMMGLVEVRPATDHKLVSRTQQAQP